MEKELKLGTVAQLKIEAVNGKLRLSVVAEGPVEAGAYVATTPDQLCDALAKLIPGDSVLEAGALNALKLGLNAAM